MHEINLFTQRLPLIFPRKKKEKKGGNWLPYGTLIGAASTTDTLSITMQCLKEKTRKFNLVYDSGFIHNTVHQKVHSINNH